MEGKLQLLFFFFFFFNFLLIAIEKQVILIAEKQAVTIKSDVFDQFKKEMIKL